MAQVFTQTAWIDDNDPAITAAQLSRMESGIFLASAPIVSVLPSSPVDGQECNFVADAVNGIVWHLVYRAASTSAYKWEVTGGSALYSNVDANSVITGAAWNNYGGPAITVPLAGDYEVSLGGRSINDLGGGGTDVTQSFTVAGSTPLAPDGNDLYTPAGQAAIQQSNTRIKTGVTAGASIAERVWTNGGNAGISARWLRVMPRRVG